MKTFVAIMALTIAGCVVKDEPAPAADTTAAAPAPVVDTAGPIVADSVMVRDTAAEQ